MGMHRWEEYAACAPQNRSLQAKDLNWYSTDANEKYNARAICTSECEVRKDCIQFALENKYINGIWGGVDDYEIRRALSVDAEGKPVERDRAPRCPFCLSRKLDIATAKNKLGYKTKCTGCDLEWYMAMIPAKLKKSKKDVA